MSTWTQMVCACDRCGVEEPVPIAGSVPDGWVRMDTGNLNGVRLSGDYCAVCSGTLRPLLDDYAERLRTWLAMKPDPSPELADDPPTAS
jgi:hypothetical protein